jgi:cell shape-determining protein MreC
MTKVLLLLSAVVMAIGGVFAYQNGRTYKEVRERTASVHAKVRTGLASLQEAVDSVAKVNGDIARVSTEKETEDEKLKSNKLKIAQTESEAKRVDDELKVKSQKMSELTAKLNSLPAGFNPQTIAEDLNKIKQEIVEFQTQAEAKKQEVAVEEKKVDEVKRGLDEIVTRIAARKKAFDRNSLTAHVVAVNNDWGFVIIDAGEKEGITPDTKLLVTRGTATVGKLSILTVAGGRTVANILGDTLAPGMAPAPGDKVILENLFQ